jgi:hypothetical protein
MNKYELFQNKALAVSQPVVKKVTAKDPPSKVMKFPPRKRFVCMKNRFGKRVCRWMPWRGPVRIMPHGPGMGPRPAPY